MYIITTLFTQSNILTYRDVFLVAGIISLFNFIFTSFSLGSDTEYLESAEYHVEDAYDPE